MAGAFSYEPGVLVIDDEESIREGCRQVLEAEGYRTGVAEDGRRGLELVVATRPDVVLVDLKMPGMNGMEVLSGIREIDPAIVCIVVTGYGSVGSAVEAMRTGAYDYLEKPLAPEQVVEAVTAVLPSAETNLKAASRLPARDDSEAFVIRLILRKAARDRRFGRKLLYEGRQELIGWALSPEAADAIVAGDVPWLIKRCGGLSGEERVWLEKRPW